MALLSFDAVPRFFARKPRANAWVAQASRVLPSGEIANNANLMYVKAPPGQWSIPASCRASPTSSGRGPS